MMRIPALAAALAAAMPLAGVAGDIAYVSVRDGNPHVYLRSASGAESQVTRGDKGYLQPAWSPDGKRLAVTSTRDGLHKVFIMNADGSDIRRVGSDDRIESAASWSPDGSSLAYFSVDPAGDAAELRILDLRTGTTLAVKGNGRGKSGPASWSADGRRLAFNGANDKGRAEIWVVERDGSGARIVSEKFNQRRKALAALSPDGRSVAYVADNRPAVDVVVTDLDSGESRVVSKAPGVHKSESPAWSPDGRRLAFASTRDCPDAVRMDIFVMNADGTGLRNLTSHPHEDYDPRWTADGRSIVFTSLRTGIAQIHTVDLETGATRRLAETTSHDMDAAPRPAPAPLRTATARTAAQQGR